MMGYKITIKQGNLLECEADIIVNASNTKLLLGSGVSMAFKRHCDKALQEAMSNVLKDAKELHQGDVVATKSYAKNFQIALHVAMMNYNKGVKGLQKMPTLKTIETALKNIEQFLKAYAKNNQKVKIALPLLGCGIGALQKEDVIRCYKNFFRRDVAFDCEVILVGYRDEDYNIIYNIFRDLSYNSDVI